MDTTNLYQVLAQIGEENDAASPYAPFTSSINEIGQAGLKLGIQQGDYKTGLMSALLGGLLGGASTGLSQNWVQNKNEQAANLLAQAIAGQNVERPSGMTPSVFSKVQNAGTLWGAQQALQQRQQDQQLEREITRQAASAIAQNPEAADTIIGSINRLRNPNAPQGLVNEPATPPTEQVVDDPLNLGRPSYEQRFNQLVTEARKKGATANAAIDYADKMTKADALDIRNTEEKLKALRDQTSALDSMIGSAEIGVEGSGETGGVGILNASRDFGSKILAHLGSKDQTRKQTAQSTLDSIGAEIVSASRSKGVGAMSDAEMKMYLKSGPSSINTPEANLALLDKYKAVSSFNKEYMNFLEKVQAKYGSTKDSDKIWQAYKSENPLFVNNGQEYVPNLDRPNVFDWLQSKNSQAPSPVEQVQSIQQQAPANIKTLPDGRTFKKVDGGWEQM
jgi:hypothetical protein